MTRRLCPRGHDTLTFGRVPNGRCRRCAAEASNRFKSRWRARRRRLAEIRAAKEILIAAHRLRAIGIPRGLEIAHFDSWSPENE